jgi:hypothetical protein
MCTAHFALMWCSHNWQCRDYIRMCRRCAAPLVSTCRLQRLHIIASYISFAMELFKLKSLCGNLHRGHAYNRGGVAGQ